MTPQQKTISEMFYQESFTPEAENAASKAFSVLNSMYMARQTKVMTGIQTAEVSAVAHCILAQQEGIQWEVYSLDENGMTNEFSEFSLDYIDPDKPKARLVIVKPGLLANYDRVAEIISRLHNENPYEATMIMADQETSIQLLPYVSSDTYCKDEI